ncbi:MAG: cyclodeaminase/cyclohydrolase family protein, partial [Ktedonobacterales bacterium]
MAEEGRSITTFLDALASGDAAPGGGAAAALAGALAAACAEMVGHFTLGRPRFAAIEARTGAVVERLAAARAELVTQMTADERAFAAVAAAYRLPKSTDDERAARAAAITVALSGAMQPPLAVMRLTNEVLGATAELGAAGNPSVASDAACAALLGEAAVRAAAVNVRVNAALLGETPQAGAAHDEVARLEG